MLPIFLPQVKLLWALKITEIDLHGTSCLVRKVKLSEEKPLPFEQRVRRPRKNSLRYGAQRENEIEKYSVWKEKKAVQIGFTKVALGKFIDQMTWLFIL